MIEYLLLILVVVAAVMFGAALGALRCLRYFEEGGDDDVDETKC